MNKLFSFAVVICLFCFSACNKTETYPTEPLSSYNLQTPGKYIIYQLDSLEYINFGQTDTVVSYYAEDLVDTTMVVDNLGRPAFRIFHFLSQSPTGPWQPNNTFMTVPLGTTVEFIENNLRYIKLHEPIENNYSWKGNAYIDTRDVTETVPNIADWDLTYLDDWDYIYQNVDQPLTLGNLAFDSTITVTERDEVIGDTTDANSYSEVNFSLEQYAKGVGLVYRNFLHREYQPATPSSGSYTTGYGVTLTIVSHN
jgi:hypothetical protein